MKKKKAKAKQQKVRNKLDKISCGSADGYPKQLVREQYFACPVWYADQENFVDDLNKASDPYINNLRKI